MLEKASDEMAKKFMDGVAAQRAKAIDTNKKEVKDQNSTRTFLKALLTGDRKALEIGDDASGGYLVPPELKAEILRISQTQFGLARRSMRYLSFRWSGEKLAT